MKPILLQAKSKSARNENLWLASALLLAALLAVSFALYRSPVQSASPETLQTNFSSAPGPAVDPVVHNIGKYVASHQIFGRRSAARIRLNF